MLLNGPTILILSSPPPHFCGPSPDAAEHNLETLHSSMEEFSRCLNSLSDQELSPSEEACILFVNMLECKRASQVVLVVMNPPANAGDTGDSGWEFMLNLWEFMLNPLEEKMATHFGILAWEIPWAVDYEKGVGYIDPDFVPKL